MLIHGIAQGQYFIEGNKRTAALACWTFLDGNGYTMNVQSITFAEWINDLSVGTTVYELAERIRGVLVKKAAPHSPLSES